MGSSGAAVENADQRDGACGIHDGRCKPEMWLFMSWECSILVWRESAVRGAVGSQGGSFSEGRVICCSWTWFLFKHLPTAGKNSMFHYPVMQLR